MIFLGLDDTDLIDTPGTNKLALEVAGLLAPRYDTRWIVRHQLLVDPRVPCTNKNGCASMALLPLGTHDPAELIRQVRELVIRWHPLGSDPGLCITDNVPDEVMAFGRRAQQEFLEQRDAIELAERWQVFLEPLGGTGSGVIGALAAVGLLASGNSGRVVYCGSHGRDAFDLAGCHSASTIYERGVEEIVSLDAARPFVPGDVDLGKRLRPNMRNGRVVLFVAPAVAESSAPWVAERIVA